MNGDRTTSHTTPQKMKEDGIAKQKLHVMLIASRVKSQSSAVRSISKPKGSTHQEIRQQIRHSLDEIENWEW